jgi:hypothetical protein
VFEQEVGFALDALMHQQPSEMNYCIGQCG